MFDKKAFIKAFLVTLVFMLGFLSSNIYANINTERPANINTTTTNGYTDEVPSPGDWIKESQIGVYNKNVVLSINDPQWSTFTDTHSMEPVLSSRANAIEVVPTSADQIQVGDIVSYVSDYADGYIIHRVIAKDSDDKGVYFTLKGDNNPEPDPGRVRFSQIQRVVVAIIY